ncbi:MAG: ATPase [Pseudomonadota bacterium]|nr:ATPase [Pseudomonadota bacterium]
MLAVSMVDETPDQRFERLSQDRIDRPLPKRFYKEVFVGPDFSILLDGRGVKTPMKAKLLLPTAELAHAVAEEWRAQVKLINPALMPFTKLANTAIDRVGAERAHIAGEVKNFAGNDLVCYRADKPADLVALQTQHWDKVLVWADDALGAKFKTTKGVIHIAQEPAALQAVELYVAGLDSFALAGVHNVMSLTGSALLALMLHARALSGADIWTAAHVDEDFQIEQWGEDFEAAARRAHRKVEFEATVRFLESIDVL